jgi:hypothetical protein
MSVAERFGHVREQGRDIDVREVGRQVIRRMGLADALPAPGRPRHHPGVPGLRLRRARVGGNLVDVAYATREVTGK